MIPNYDMLSFNRPRDEIKQEESSINNQSPDAIATWMRNRALADPMINQSDKRLQTTMAEIAVLERLAKRKGYSYTNKESPSTMNAYYKSEWYVLRRKQQELQQIDMLDRANERLLNSSDIPKQLVPSYINMVVNGAPKEEPKKAPKVETYIDASQLQQKKEKERKLQIANEKRRREEIEQHNRLQEQKCILELQEQRRLIEDEKKRKDKIAAHQEKVKRDKERQIKEKEALEEQKRLDKEAAIQKQKLYIEQKKEEEPISKQIDELLSRKIKEQYRPPKDPPPPVSREEFDKAQQQKAERAHAIRMAKQNAEKLHRKLLEEKAKEKVQEPISEKKQKEIERKALQNTPEMIEARRKSDLASKQLDILFKNEEKLYNSRTEFSSIYIILLCFNESVILPHTIAHYRSQFPFCEFIIYDNESTDNSVMIAKELGCHVVSWSSNQINDEGLKIKIRNKCWNHIKEGWIIMADMDEWIYITEEELKEEEKKGTSILSIEGLEMVGESQTLDFSDIDLNQIKQYVPFSEESKNLCFFRNKIGLMNFGSGSHTCRPNGIVSFSSKIYQLHHMCYLGLPFLIDKMKKRFKRSALNRSKGWSVHYTDDEKKITDKYNKLLADSISL